MFQRWENFCWLWINALLTQLKVILYTESNLLVGVRMKAVAFFCNELKINDNWNILTNETWLSYFGGKSFNTMIQFNTI